MSIIFTSMGCFIEKVCRASCCRLGIRLCFGWSLGLLGFSITGMHLWSFLYFLCGALHLLCGTRDTQFLHRRAIGSCCLLPYSIRPLGSCTSKTDFVWQSLGGKVIFLTLIGVVLRVCMNAISCSDLISMAFF